MARKNERFVCSCGKRWSITFDTPRCRFRCKICGTVHSLPKRSPLEVAAQESLDEQETNNPASQTAPDSDLAKLMVTAPDETPLGGRMLAFLAIGTVLLFVLALAVGLAQRQTGSKPETPLVKWEANPSRVSELQPNPTQIEGGRFQLPTGFEVWLRPPRVKFCIWRGEIETPSGIEVGTIQVLFDNPDETSKFAERFVRRISHRISPAVTSEEGSFLGYKCTRLRFEDARKNGAETRYRCAFVVELPERVFTLSCSSSLGWETPFMELMQTSVLSLQLDPPPRQSIDLPPIDLPRRTTSAGQLAR